MRGKLRQALVALLLVSAGGTAFAGESCSSVKKINGVLTDVPVPCATLDRALACSKTTVDANGSTLIEDVPCAPGKQRTMQQAEREELAAQKRTCGRDFQAMRIGMRLDRFEECNEALSFITETVSKGSVVETYRSTFYLIHARDGRIVAWTRR